MDTMLSMFVVIGVMLTIASFVYKNNMELKLTTAVSWTFISVFGFVNAALVSNTLSMVIWGALAILNLIPVFTYLKLIEK